MSDPWTRVDIGNLSFLHDLEFDARLTQGLRLPFELSEREFDSFDRVAVARKVAAMRSEGKVVFDAPKIRLSTDPRQGDVGLQRTSYFAGLGTNVVSDYRDCLSISNLGQSNLSDDIGVTGIAVDLDGRVPLVRARKTNAIGGGKLGPSGSGSCDPEDFLSSNDLVDAIVSGIERETREEVGLPDDVELRTQVVGFYRDLSRGGKPEFVGLTRIVDRLSTLSLVRSEQECVFSDRVSILEGGIERIRDWASEREDVSDAFLAAAFHVGSALEHGLSSEGYASRRDTVRSPGDPRFIEHAPMVR